MTTAPFASPEPLFRVEKGSAGPSELAALTAVLLHRAACDVRADECRTQAPRWSRAGTRPMAGSPLSWRSAPGREDARRP
ncbi:MULTISPECIES: acyl-CoA carboxylase subunit epsilon [unclassified Streptomyces]|jgi:hypothetical protein|uniref:acyl-CoA carboxylase subunit epsilon n=1 Tax=unclassified Streptomyces TaxID=2593676 RepID=UPI002E25BB53